MPGYPEGTNGRQNGPERAATGKLCEVCGKQLIGQQRRFCSPRCNRTYWNPITNGLRTQRRQLAVAEQRCTRCGNPVTGYLRNKRYNLFCSRRCLNLFWNKKRQQPYRSLIKQLTELDPLFVDQLVKETETSLRRDPERWRWSTLLKDRAPSPAAERVRQRAQAS